MSEMPFVVLYFLCMLGVYFLYREGELEEPVLFHWTTYFFILVWPVTLILLGMLLVLWAVVKGLADVATRMGF